MAPFLKNIRKLLINEVCLVEAPSRMVKCRSIDAHLQEKDQIIGEVFFFCFFFVNYNSVELLLNAFRKVLLVFVHPFTKHDPVFTVVYGIGLK